MGLWSAYKRGFDAWEGATAAWLEIVMKSPLVLRPAGEALSGIMRSKAGWDKLLHQAWGAAGLATKRDQERTLHALNQLQSRLLDLEEKLEQKSEPRPKARVTHPD